MLRRAYKNLNALSFPAWTAPLALFLAVLAAYGLRLSTLGFYWDDWPYLWFYHALGPAGMYASLGADRPLLGVLYALTLGALGVNPLAWQIFALVLRWLCALGFWLALCQAWPGTARCSQACSLRNGRRRWKGCHRNCFRRLRARSARWDAGW